jgi:hypothetical protein
MPWQQEYRRTQAKNMDSRRTEAKNILTTGEQKQRIPSQQENSSKEYLEQQDNRSKEYLKSRRTEAKNTFTAGEQKQRILSQQKNKQGTETVLEYLESTRTEATLPTIPKRPTPNCATAKENIQNNKRLKGQCHAIFDFRFSARISFPQAPVYTIHYSRFELF